MSYNKHYELIGKTIETRNNFFTMFCASLNLKFNINTEKLKQTFFRNMYNCFSISVKPDIINIVLYDYEDNTDTQTNYAGFSFFPKEGTKFIKNI